jgi:predicted ribosome quality control (RQC) complex YloA/Tae2 family protein
VIKLSIDGRFIEKLALELNDELENIRIQKISQLGKADFLFMLNHEKNLYLSLSTATSRLNLTKAKYDTFLNPGGFCMFLRKYIEKGIIKSVNALNSDRVIEIKINNRNELGDMSDYYLIFEFFGRYANLIITDENKIIINAFKHIHPFDNTDRTIINGVAYPLPKDDKLSPHDLTGIKEFFSNQEITYKTIIERIRGVSPLLAKTIIKIGNYQNEQIYQAYEKLYNQEVLPTKSKNKFYYLDIFNENQEYYNNLSELLEAQFQQVASLERVRQIHKYLANFVKNNLEKNQNKLEKLSKDLHEATNNQINRIKGDLLIQNNYLIDRSLATVSLFSYELNEQVEIEIDRLLSPIENANKYYQKYKKQKSAINHIKTQIIITKREINYFFDLVNQIEDNFNYKDLEEIQNELIEKNYLSKNKKVKKSKRPNYDIYLDELGIEIYVGKNNLQNNFLTHKLAKKDYWWFHVQNQTSAHVIVASNSTLEESTLRAAANLCALNSKAKNSSSVPVDYTLVKYLKKIPGEFGSKVTYQNQKTIYIDPDYQLVEKLRKGK